MKLIYIWIEKYKGIINKGIKMDNNYIIHKEKNFDNFTIIDKNANKNKFSLYSDKNIMDSYLLLGKNGVGKSTVLDLMFNGDSSSIQSNEKEDLYYLFFENDGYYYVFSSFSLQKKTITINKKEINVLNRFFEEGEKLVQNICTINLCRDNNDKIKSCVNEYIRNLYRKINNLYKTDEIKKDLNDTKLMLDEMRLVLNGFSDSYYFKYNDMGKKSFEECYIDDIDIIKSLAINKNILFKNTKEKKFYLRYTNNKYPFNGLITPVYRKENLCGFNLIYSIVEKFLSFVKSATFSIYDHILLNLNDDLVTLKVDEYKNETLKKINDFKEKLLVGVDIKIDSLKESALNLNSDLCSYLEKMNNDIELKFNDIVKKINDDIKNMYDFYFFIIDFISNNDFLYGDSREISFDYSVLYDSEKEEFDETKLEFLKNLLFLYNDEIELIYGKSTGEKSLIELTACITKILETLEKDFSDSKICYLLLDEIEENLHPEWSRITYSTIEEIINNFNTKHKYYIYLTTHSPYIISDFTSDHIINLDNTEGMDFNTFGANIHDILNKGMFLSNSIGEFACQCITNLITDLEGNSDEPTYDDKTTEYIINCIGEPFIKNHLKLLYEKKKKTKMKQKYEHMTKEELIELLERKEHDQNRN